MRSIRRSPVKTLPKCNMRRLHLSKSKSLHGAELVLDCECLAEYGIEWRHVHVPFMAVLGGPSAIVHYCWRRPRMQEVLGPCSTGLRCRCVKSCNTPWGESAPDSTSLLCKDRVCSMISMFCCFCIILHHSASLGLPRGIPKWWPGCGALVCDHMAIDQSPDSPWQATLFVTQSGCIKNF